KERRGEGSPRCEGLTHACHVARLRAFRTFDNLELHRLSFVQCAKARALDGREMHEHVRAAATLDEAVALGVVEPLDLPADPFHRTDLPCLAASASGWQHVTRAPNGLTYRNAPRVACADGRGAQRPTG